MSQREDGVSTNPSASEMLSGSVVFHRVTLSEQKRAFLGALGYILLEANTVERVLRLVHERRVDTIVTTLSSGGSAPERLKSTLDELTHHERPRLLLTARYASEPLRRRAASLGCSAIYLWPEGILGRLVEMAQGPTLAMRAAERVVLRQTFIGKALGSGGQVINLSASGALVLLKEPTLEDTITLTLRLPRETSPVALAGTVIRRQQVAGGEQLALRFADISPQTQARIQRFVRACNIIKVGGEPSRRSTRHIKVKARVHGDRRSDYFTLCDVSGEEALLVPKIAFVPPYAAGTVLELSVLGPRGLQIEAVVQGRERREHSHDLPLTCWRVQLRAADAAELSLLLAQRRSP